MSKVNDILLMEILYIFERVIVMTTEQQLREQIIEKAWTDADFKQQLLADPKAAIQSAFGIEIPANYTLQVLEETADSYYLVLPQNPAANASEDDDVLSRWV